MTGVRGWALLALALALVAGCAPVSTVVDVGDSGSRGDTVVISPQVEGLEILELRDAAAPDGTRTVSLTLRSNAGVRQTLRYRALWFDARGIEMRTSVSNWNRRVIEAGQVFDAVLVGPGPAARGLRIEVEKSPH